MADFCLVSRRTLEDFEYQLFRVHYLLGADWRLCCRQLKMERGVLFHHLYSIENRLGRVFAELTPYALYPLSEYFAGATRRDAQQETLSDLAYQNRSLERTPLPLSA
jgi:hypothetical protein